ncbi:MAG: endonuclease V [Nitrospiraceae bacterium]|nr:MAG: endonuclease V [Nitrospiraceae bacterium]
MDVPENITEAKKVQCALKKKVRIKPLDKMPSFVAGVDAAFFQNTIIAVACLYTFPELAISEDAHSIEKVHFPYVPGYLSFREGPAIIHAVHKLSRKPDLILFDGQGIAHPQGLGIASHIGVLLNMPTIGCAKSRLIGTYKTPGYSKGDYSSLLHKGKIIGTVLRTRDKVKPVFISPGHLIDVKSSMDILIKCTTRYRLPEPIRRADRLSGELKHQYKLR